MEDYFCIKDSNLISLGKEQITLRVKLELQKNSIRESIFVFVKRGKLIFGTLLLID